MGELRTLGSEGDIRKTWDSDNPIDVEDARRSFNDLKKKGYLAYAVKKKGKKGTVVDEFDPEMEQIIMAPPMAGG